MVGRRPGLVVKVKHIADFDEAYRSDRTGIPGILLRPIRGKHGIQSIWIKARIRRSKIVGMCGAGSSQEQCGIDCGVMNSSHRCLFKPDRAPTSEETSRAQSAVIVIKIGEVESHSS